MRDVGAGDVFSVPHEVGELVDLLRQYAQVPADGPSECASGVACSEMETRFDVLPPEHLIGQGLRVQAPRLAEPLPSEAKRA